MTGELWTRAGISAFVASEIVRRAGRECFGVSKLDDVVGAAARAGIFHGLTESRRADHREDYLRRLRAAVARSVDFTMSTPADRRLFAHILRGRSIAEIAAFEQRSKGGTAVEILKFYDRAGISAKSGGDSRARVVRSAIAAGLLDHSISRAPSTARRPGRRAEKPRGGALESLTARQLEWVALVAEGLSNRELAQKMRVSEGYVGSRLPRLYRRLGIVCESSGILRRREVVQTLRDLFAQAEAAAG